jgi:Na+/H+-translocating membrane pyrophosphatase
MKRRLVFTSLLLLALSLLVVPIVLASSTWYVDGVNGSNKNNCKTAQTACKTIKHGISLAHSGDSIMVATATYKENLTIPFSLKVLGSGASTTIIDGGGSNTFKSVVATSFGADVTLSKLTIRNGFAFMGVGGGIANQGTLTIIDGMYASVPVEAPKPKPHQPACAFML